MESSLRQIRIAKPSSPVWLVTEAFVTKWNQRISKIHRWQFMWNASNRRSSAFRRVHDSEPYNTAVRRWQGHCKAVSLSVNAILSASRCWQDCMDLRVFSLHKWIFSASGRNIFSLLRALPLDPHQGSAPGPRWGTSIPRPLPVPLPNQSLGSTTVSNKSHHGDMPVSFYQWGEGAVFSTCPSCDWAL